MDASDTRRGRPATHRAFADAHRAAGLARRPGAVRRVGGDPARRPAADLVRRAAAPLRPAGRPRGRRPRGLRPHPQRGHHRPVPRRLGAGARPGRRGRRDDGAALQVGQVLHRAPAAHRRPARRRDARAAGRADGVRPPARRGLPAPRRPARACTATRPPPGSPPATTWSRASGRCWSPWRSTPLPRRTRPVWTPRWARPLSEADVAELRRIIDASGAHAQLEQVIDDLVTLSLAKLDASSVHASGSRRAQASWSAPRRTGRSEARRWSSGHERQVESPLPDVDVSLVPKTRRASR